MSQNDPFFAQLVQALLPVVQQQSQQRQQAAKVESKPSDAAGAKKSAQHEQNWASQQTPPGLRSPGPFGGPPSGLAPTSKPQTGSKGPQKVPARKQGSMKQMQSEVPAAQGRLDQEDFNPLYPVTRSSDEQTAVREHIRQLKAGRPRWEPMVGTQTQHDIAKYRKQAQDAMQAERGIFGQRIKGGLSRDAAILAGTTETAIIKSKLGKKLSTKEAKALALYNDGSHPGGNPMDAIIASSGAMGPELEALGPAVSGMMRGRGAAEEAAGAAVRPPAGEPIAQSGKPPAAKAAGVSRAKATQQAEAKAEVNAKTQGPGTAMKPTAKQPRAKNPTTFERDITASAKRTEAKPKTTPQAAAQAVNKAAQTPTTKSATTKVTTPKAEATVRSTGGSRTGYKVTQENGEYVARQNGKVVGRGETRAAAYNQARKSPAQAAPAKAPAAKTVPSKAPAKSDTEKQDIISKLKDSIARVEAKGPKVDKTSPNGDKPTPREAGTSLRDRGVAPRQLKAFRAQLPADKRAAFDDLSTSEKESFIKKYAALKDKS